MIEADYGKQYVPSSPRQYVSKSKNAQEAHEAIRPAGDRFRRPEDIAREVGLARPNIYRYFSSKDAIVLAFYDRAQSRMEPRIEEASKPKPSSKLDSPSSPMGKVKCCQEPGRSVKRTETNFAPSSEAYFKTVFAFMCSPDC